jgi:hypothetical protein
MIECSGIVQVDLHWRIWDMQFDTLDPGPVSDVLEARAS